MAIYTNLPIYRASYGLLLSINQLMLSVPRDCRYSIGQDVRRKVMDLIILIYRANRTKQKIQHILAMREALLEIQVYIRLMGDMRYISERKYLELAETTSDMSKQMVLWEKSEAKKYGNGN